MNEDFYYSEMREDELNSFDHSGVDSGEFDEEEDKEVHLGFVRLIGEEVDGFYNYEFIFTDNIDDFWGEDFEYSPCSLINDLRPDDKYITEVVPLKTKLRFDLVQNNGCFSMQDCMDGIIALAWENIDDYDVYPEEGRVFFQFGESFESIERKLAMKQVLFRDKVRL